MRPSMRVHTTARVSRCRLLCYEVPDGGLEMPRLRIGMFLGVSPLLNSTDPGARAHVHGFPKRKLPGDTASWERKRGI